MSVIAVKKYSDHIKICADGQTTYGYKNKKYRPN